ncbi:MAG: Ltp family lipoprotein [Cryobacterium sp.]|nr:Ltp family lipoprotein [Cryobacterium sp.]
MTSPESDDSHEPVSAELPSPSPSLSSPATATMPPPPLKAPMGLALAALLVGIGAFLFGLAPVFGALVGIAAIVLGVLALRKQQPKGMAVTGIVLGAIAAIASIGMTAGISTVVNRASDDKPSEVIAQSMAPSEEPSVSPSPVETKAPEPEAPKVSPEFKSALIKAGSYSEIMHMSKAAIYDQLTSQYGEKFSPEAAQYAVDNVKADWNANALAKAKSYQEEMAMSPEAIRDQLTSEYGEKFTAAQADYAIRHLND